MLSALAQSLLSHKGEDISTEYPFTCQIQFTPREFLLFCPFELHSSAARGAVLAGAFSMLTTDRYNKRMFLHPGPFMLEPICFSLSDEAGHCEVTENLTELFCCVINLRVLLLPVIFLCV
jgi:hypothetical protein